MRIKLTGLWQHADFLRLWSGQTISAFGSMVGITAMSFTAVLFLNATPFQMGVLNAMQLLPGFLVGLYAGAWADRVRRRPLMISADLGRALALATIPLAALFGVLHIEQLFVVALLTSVFSIFFNVAYQSYLPTLVNKNDIIEGNSKLTASAAVAEFGGFSIGGWLVQALTAPLAILIDAGSFVISAISIGLIRNREQEMPPAENANVHTEIIEGLQVVWQHPLLRAGAVSVLVHGLSSGIFGALVVIYMSRDLGFNPGLLGTIWAVGGVSSFVAAALAPRVTKWIGPGLAMISGLWLFGLSEIFVPLATGATLISAVFLIIQQLGDGFYIIYEINFVSMRQTITGEHLLGRVNATMEIIVLGSSLAGALIGGFLGEIAGVRISLLLGAAGNLLAALILALSPVRKLKTALEVQGENA